MGFKCCVPQHLNPIQQSNLISEKSFASISLPSESSLPNFLQKKEQFAVAQFFELLKTITRSHHHQASFDQNSQSNIKIRYREYNITSHCKNIG